MLEPIQRLKAYLKQSFDVLPDKLPELPNLDYSVDRFGLAYRKTRNLGPDEIVLLRQAVRWSDMDRIGVKRTTEQTEKVDRWIKKAGVTWTTGGFLSAEPYAPGWLSEKKVTMDEKPQLRARNEEFAGEPYLRQNLDFGEWLSPAQKEAVWTVLNSPDGSTCTIVLPTGCGKSTCFWLLPTLTQGLTVVVVPTVALAMDQQQNVSNRFKNFSGVDPCFFAADDSPEITIDKIKRKKSRLVFASPETCVSGKLRGVLDGFARDGWLRNLVVDEAHIIETWGVEFRVEFQILSAVRKKWLEESSGKLRTFLFSATMSPRCRESLREMFSEENHVQEFICQRLRPEMKYFSLQFDDDEVRWKNLLEAIWRLDRPAILYKTKPIDAKDLHKRLRDEEGFQRIGCFTGETGHSERKMLLEAWKNNEIDLMVATSAFGLGVDKADVRTVIHACYPENLDRYYQEVGRSGRDGYSSICILMPTEGDKKIAKGLGIKMMSDEQKIQERWEAMYTKRKLVQGEEYIFKLKVSVKRLGIRGNRTYSQNIIWNKSLLLQLLRAKLIEFLDQELVFPENPEDELEEWAKVRVCFPPGTIRLGRSLQLQNSRERELEHFNKGFTQLEKLFSSMPCVSLILKELYEISSSQRVCGGCRFCRDRCNKPAECPSLLVPESKFFPERPTGTIIEGWPDPTQPSQKDDFIDKIEYCLNKHSLKPLHIYCPKDHFEEILELLKETFNQYSYRYRIDPFNEHTVLRCYGDSPKLFLHFGVYNEDMLKKAQKHNSNHFFCGVQNPDGPHGRHIKMTYAYHSCHSPEVWLRRLN